MSGSLIALLSALCFAASNICTRRGVLRIRDAALGGYVSVFIAPPLFLLVALIIGDLHNIGQFTWKGYLWLAMAGIIHFVAGRSSSYWSLKYLGANMASVFSGLNLVYTILLGFFVLGEHVTRNMVLGSVLIIIGPSLLAWPQKSGTPGSKVEDGDKPRLSRKGIMAALISGIFFGISPLFIKWGLQEGGSALAGTFVSYTSATLILGMTMLNPTRKGDVIHMEHRALLWFSFSGIFVGLAQFLRFSALKLTQISIAGPLIATSRVWLLLLSFIVNRKVESFRINVVVGTILTMLGAVLVYR